MNHICAWRTVKEWRQEPAENSWSILRQHKVQRCSICAKEKPAQVADVRRRERAVIPSQLRPPKQLLEVLPAKQWRSLAQILQSMGGNRLDLERLLEQWLRDGWIQIEEHRDRYGASWVIDKARISDGAYKEFVERPQSDLLAQQQREIETMLLRLQGWQRDLEQARRSHSQDSALDQLFDRLQTILNEQEQALRDGRWLVLPNTSQRAGSTLHQRWLQVCRGLVALLASNQWEYERTFSAQWLGDSKQLTRDRKPIEDFLGIKLEDLGLFRHSPIVYCWGAFEGRYRGLAIDGQAGEPFIALAAETVRNLTDVRIESEFIFVVENQTAFETVLRNPLRKESILYLYSGGHAGLAERELLATWLRASPNTPWYVWTDWDLGGVRIQADWTQWATDRAFPAPIPWMWDEESLSRWQALGKPLADRERDQLLQHIHPLATKLVHVGYTLEQERVLPHLIPDDFDQREQKL